MFKVSTNFYVSQNIFLNVKKDNLNMLFHSRIKTQG